MRGGADENYALEAEKMKIYRSSQGKLVVCIEGEEWENLSIRRAFPLEDAEHYIGFFRADGTELGLLEEVGELDPESRRILLDELDKVYFRPVILEIEHIGEEFGVVHAEVLTTSGRRHLEIRGIRNKIRILSGRRALIEDVEGNRYVLGNWDELPKLTRDILGL